MFRDRSPTAANSTVFVVIDMQHGFRDLTSQWCVPRYDEIVPVIDVLRKSLKRPTFFTRFVPEPDERGAWQAYYDYWSQMRLPVNSATWDITLSISDQSQVVTASTFSKWPQLAPYVPLGARLIVSGVATDCCVLSTVLGAVDAGRFVTLVSDACAALNDQAQKQTLELLRLLFPLCTVISSAELLQSYVTVRS
jgi:nicotinamidase-related amidase